MYTREEELEIAARIGVTKEVYELLRNEKKRLKKLGESESMAKIVCNLVIKALNKHK